MVHGKRVFYYNHKLERVHTSNSLSTYKLYVYLFTGQYESMTFFLVDKKKQKKTEWVREKKKNFVLVREKRVVFFSEQ